MENLNYQKRNHSHKVKWIYYNPDGSVKYEIKRDFIIKSIWEDSWIQAGLGWKHKGNWKKGYYRINLYIDDKYIGERGFQIR